MADIAEVFRRATSAAAAPAPATRSSFRSKPISYDGKTDYNLFQAQFRMIARTEEWSDERQGRELARCLTDDALEVFLRLPESQHADFQSVDTALSASFGKAYNRREHARRLHDTRQLATQTLREYARSIEQQGLLAYKDYPDHIRQEHLIDAFVHGLQDPFVRALLQRENFSTLYDALEAAERTVPLDTAKRVRVVDVDAAAAAPSPDPMAVLLAKVTALEERLQQQPQQQSTSDQRDVPAKFSKTADGQTAAQRRRDGVCHNCGIRGHFKFECRQRPRATVTCSRCGQHGHFPRQCRQPSASSSGSGNA